MAYQASYMTEEEKQKQQAAGASGSGVSTSGVQSAYTSPGSGSGVGAAPAASEKTPGTGFVNLQQYLDMNEGAGGQMASTATAGAVKEADAVKTKVAGTAKEGAQAIKAADGSDAASKIVQGIVTDASAVKDSAAAFLGKGYAGPTAADYTEGLTESTKAVSDKLTGLSQDAAYQQSTLADVYGKQGGPAYTQGFGLLDQFLVSGTKSGQQVLKQVGEKATDVAKTADSATKALTKAEEDAKKTFEQNQKQVYGTAVDVYDATFGKKIDEAKKVDAKYAADIKKDGGKGASLGDVVTADELADIEALGALLGETLDPNWYAKTFRKGKDKPVQTFEPKSGTTDIPPIGGGGDGGGGSGRHGGSGSNALDHNENAIEAAADLGADISDGWKNSLPGKVVSGVADQAGHASDTLARWEKNVHAGLEKDPFGTLIKESARLGKQVGDLDDRFFNAAMAGVKRITKTDLDKILKAGLTPMQMKGLIGSGKLSGSGADIATMKAKISGAIQAANMKSLMPGVMKSAAKEAEKQKAKAQKAYEDALAAAAKAEADAREAAGKLADAGKDVGGKIAAMGNKLFGGGGDGKNVGEQIVDGVKHAGGVASNEVKKHIPKIKVGGR